MATPTKTIYKGADATIKQLQNIIKFAPNQFEKALRQEAEIEAKECKRRCPVDTGNLRATIHVEGPFRDWRKVWCLVACGGPAASYALIVHEDLEARHEVGEAKFIERPLKESAPYMPARIAARINLNNARDGKEESTGDGGGEQLRDEFGRFTKRK